jgi:hypothetical protein
MGHFVSSPPDNGDSDSMLIILNLFSLNILMVLFYSRNIQCDKTKSIFLWYLNWTYVCLFSLKFIAFFLIFE